MTGPAGRGRTEYAGVDFDPAAGLIQIATRMGADATDCLSENDADGAAGRGVESGAAGAMQQLPPHAQRGQGGHFPEETARTVPGMSNTAKLSKAQMTAKSARFIGVKISTDRAGPRILARAEGGPFARRGLVAPRRLRSPCPAGGPVAA